MRTSARTRFPSATPQPASTVFPKAATAAAGLLLLAAPARGAATIVYDNMVSASTIHNGRENDPDAPNWLHADGFQFAAPATFNLVTWHGLREFSPDRFRMRIYTIVGNVPAMTPIIDLPLGLVTRFDTGYRDPYQTVIYSYSAGFPDQSLAAGSYAISIVSDSANDGVPWAWAVGNNNDGSFMILKGDTAWRNMTGAPEFSFVLAQVPEPAPAVLAFAMVPFALSRRRR